MKKLLTTTVAAVALATSACASYGDTYSASDSAPALGNVAAEGQVDPAVWKLSDEDTTVYLLGTFHLLPKDLEWRTDTIDAALAASDEIYFEIEDDLRDPSAIMPLIQSMAIDPTQPSLAERIGDENAARVAELLTPAGIPAQALNIMENWFIALTLSSVTAMKFGYDTDSGVEIVLRGDVDERGLPVKGLETAEEQLGHLDGMSAEAQTMFLTESLVPDEEMRATLDGMLESWKRGDIDGIAATFNEGAPIGSEVRQALLTNRNADWTGDIVERMGQPGTVFVAVGAGHLVGDDSVINMLAEKGYVATRIDD
ncbi:MAG: TraB/GumN family protein [Sphingomonas sp.]|nr:TraB/GumN family protein [Sphingomonas sp.]